MQKIGLLCRERLPVLAQNALAGRLGPWDVRVAYAFPPLRRREALRMLAQLSVLTLVQRTSQINKQAVLVVRCVMGPCLFRGSNVWTLVR